jgi:hypothetical protein
MQTERAVMPSVMLDQRKDRAWRFQELPWRVLFVAISSLSMAETGAPSGQGSTTGDPAASSQNAKNKPPK